MRRVKTAVPAPLTLAVFAIFTVFAILPQSFAQTETVSRTFFSQTEQNFQNVPRGSYARRAFPFVNVSSEPIRLLGARASCGCVRVFVPKQKTFVPGAGASVVVELDAVRFTGVRDATVFVYFAAASRPERVEIPLRVRAVIVDDVRVEPSRLRFLVDELATPENASRRNRRAVVFAPLGERIVRAESSTPFVSVRLEAPRQVGAERATPLLVSVDESAPVGPFDAVVSLWSDGSTRRAPTTLSVEGTVRPSLSVSPSTLNFSAFRSGAPVVKNVVVASSRPFALARVESPNAAFSARIPDAPAPNPAVDPVPDADGDAAPNAPDAPFVVVVPVVFDPTRLAPNAEKLQTRFVVETTDGRAAAFDAFAFLDETLDPTETPK
ncbi:MAG: DUF1573 domain-containing protein [Thermoguttaceae bacterium]|nr:DUF1573 domain-containing protein [Thermoguttaceae bacterium]